jgi:hypothetical protein
LIETPVNDLQAELEPGEVGHRPAGLNADHVEPTAFGGREEETLGAAHVEQPPAMSPSLDDLQILFEVSSPVVAVSAGHDGAVEDAEGVQVGSEQQRLGFRVADRRV